MKFSRARTFDDYYLGASISKTKGAEWAYLYIHIGLWFWEAAFRFEYTRKYHDFKRFED